ncbi:hypothetical protein PLGE761_02330 [Pluralibacter gergoviae]|uniref:hypothetical protein n=1 Tax=Pluralibacter gergoviae TaxID=61647 RepID=UPI0007DAE420|nr:hypothetical protein [Pluralibacter gergoviae]SUB71822.1 Uncharacterised protein [Pluralibacter gergoviae]
MKAKITALPVDRDPEYGFWTHPALDELCGGREGVPPAEFNEWLNANALEHQMTWLDGSDDAAAYDEYFSGNSGTFTKWKPEKPHGDGRFVASIHDTEDGPICIWLRERAA